MAKVKQTAVEKKAAKILAKLKTAELAAAAEWPMRPTMPGDDWILAVVQRCVIKVGMDPTTVSSTENLGGNLLGWVTLGLSVLADRLDVGFSHWRIDVTKGDLNVGLTVGDVVDLIKKKIAAVV